MGRIRACLLAGAQCAEHGRAGGCGQLRVAHADGGGAPRLSTGSCLCSRNRMIKRSSFRYASDNGVCSCGNSRKPLFATRPAADRHN